MWNELILSILFFAMIISVFAFGYVIGVKSGYRKHEKMFKGIEKMNESWMIFYREQAGFRLRMLLKQNLSEEDKEALKTTENWFLDEQEKRFKEAENT